MRKQRARLKRDAIERALIARNLTKAEFARRIGIVRTHFHDLLAGRVYPGPGTRSRILKAFGGAFDDWFQIVDVRGRRIDSPGQSRSRAAGRRKRAGRRTHGASSRN